MLRSFSVIVFSLLAQACYIEGGGCSGPVCFYGSTDVCDGSGYCSNEGPERCPDADDIQIVATQEINRVRSTPTRCTTANFPSTNSLVWSQELFQAADRHSLDMASNNFIAQIGSTGLGVGDRVNDNVTYISQSVAGGFANTRALIAEWLQTDDCAALVDARATGFGLACRYDGDSNFGQYWTLVSGNLQL